MVAQSNLTKRGSVIVAVSFNEHTKALIETAVDVCRRSDLGLRLLHVLVPPPPAIWYGEVTGGLRLADVAEAEFEISKNEALFQLEQLAKEIPAGIEVAVSVMTDEVADGLFSEVRTSDAQLIICGCVGGSYRFVPKSLSNVLSIMAYSPVPVLVLNESAPHPFPSERLRMLVLDDLSEETGHVFAGSFKFLSRMQGIDILHMHVSGLNRASLAAGLTAANAAGRNGINIENEVDDIFSVLQDKLVARLTERSKPLRKSLESHQLNYTSRIEYGNINEAVERTIWSFRPDVLCFGKHRGIHHKPFGIGQVPYSSMLKYTLPLMVMSGEGRADAT